MSDLHATERSSVAKSASKVMAGGVFTLAAGLINQIVIAALFGAGGAMDAYLTALVIPNYFQVVVLWNISFAFIPMFIREQEKGDEENAWALVGTFFWIITVVLLVVALTGSLFSTQIIALSAPGYFGEKAELAAHMLSILMLTTPLMALNGFTTGIQNARNHFFWPSIAPAIGTVVNAGVVIVLSPSQGPMALCWGGFFSILSQASVTVIPILKHGWKKVLPLSNPQVVALGKLIAPLITFGFIISLSSVVERYFASGLPDGELSYMGYANKISGIFVAFLASGIAAAIFPSMARAFSQAGISGLAEKSNYGMKISCAVALPAVLIVSAVSTPLIHILFERGAFLPSSTVGVSRIIFAVMLSDLLFRMIGNILSRTYYVLQDTLTPPIISAITTLLYIATGRFFVNQWGYSGLVWARTLQNGLSIVFLWAILFYQKKVGKSGSSLLPSILEYSAAAVFAHFVIGLVLSKLSPVPVVFQLIAGAFTGLFLYLTYLYFRDREIMTSILEMTGVQSVLDIFGQKRIL